MKQDKIKKKAKMVSCLILIVIFLGGCNKHENIGSDMNKLLVLQEQQRKAHIQKDADLLLGMFADDFRSIDSGKILSPTKEESRNRFQSYFDRVEFLAWDNVEEPVIRISEEGSMAYIIVKKFVHLRTILDGQASVESETTFAWMETWEKVAGEWKMKAIASTNTQQNDAEMDYRQLIRQYYQAYRNRDRDALRDLLETDMRHTSNFRTYTDRDKMLEDIWPAVGKTWAEDLQIFGEYPEFMVRYKVVGGEQRARNMSEYIRFDGDKITEIEVFTGREL